ncbi:Sulfite reductase [NADPH] hemoprotein beta-component [compost metagenome]
MAESERYLPTLIDKLDVLMDESGLRDEEIVIRMTGCPNGCARPSLAEIAFIGKAPGKYNMYLGGGFAGNRLNKLFKENIGEAEILDSLQPIVTQYAKERREGEHFGDFVIRAGYVAEVRSGQDFHS